mgnify:FL=1
MNVGKRFEADIKASIPENILFYRFKDSPASFNSFNQDSNIRFTTSNVCDCLIFKTPMLFFIELKTTQGKSYSLNDSANKQLERFRKLGDHADAIKAFIINFREYEKTYFITTKDLEEFLKRTGKKSIRIDECHEIGVLISQKKLRTNYRYQIEDIFNMDKAVEIQKLFDINYQ